MILLLLKHELLLRLLPEVLPVEEEYRAYRDQVDERVADHIE